MNRCLKCFKEFEDGDICPFCGYKEGTKIQETHYLKPGIVLQNRYIIGVSVGAGGFGVTYAAWDEVLGQKVAVKEYMPGEFSTRAPGETKVTVYGGEKTEQFRQGMEKFDEESRRLAVFHNIPGIVQIFNTFQENGTVYIIMEFLEGETLEERLKREDKIAPDKAVKMMLMILQALEAVHKEGILHRDIAPNNIFLTEDGEVKLLDFGAARSVTGTHSKSLTVLYKEGYTPEEQYRSRGEQGPWTDVYASAATLYRMISGEVPPGSLERRMKDTLKPLTKKSVKVSRNISVAVMNAMNVDARRRTQSVEQFIAELTGMVKVSSHYERTMERHIGKMPFAVKMGAFFSISAILIFIIMLGTGVVKVEAPTFESFLLPDGKTRVPNIVNCEIEEAQGKLENAELKFLITDKQVSTQIPENRILSQEIEAGTVLDVDTEVKVTVSAGLNSLPATELEENGIKVVEMPDLQYMDRDEALGILADARVDVSVEYETTGIVEGGRVTRQSVSAGERIMADTGEPIILTIEDFVMDWTGSDEIEDIIREAIGQESGDVYASQLLKVKELWIEMYGDSLDIRYPTLKNQMNLSVLQNCLNLTGLFIDGYSWPAYTVLEGMDYLSNLVALEWICMSMVRIDDFSWMNNLKNLEDIDFYRVEIGNINVVKELDELYRICFQQVDIDRIENFTLFRNVSQLVFSQENLKKIQEILNQLDLYRLNLSNEISEIPYHVDVTKDMIPYLAEIAKISELELQMGSDNENSGENTITVEEIAENTTIEKLIVIYTARDGSTHEEEKTGELNSYR